MADIELGIGPKPGALVQQTSDALLKYITYNTPAGARNSQEYDVVKKNVFSKEAKDLSLRVANFLSEKPDPKIAGIAEMPFKLFEVGMEYAKNKAIDENERKARYQMAYMYFKAAKKQLELAGNNAVAKDAIKALIPYTSNQDVAGSVAEFTKINPENPFTPAKYFEEFDRAGRTGKVGDKNRVGVDENANKHTLNMVNALTQLDKTRLSVLKEADKEFFTDNYSKALENKAKPHGVPFAELLDKPKAIATAEAILELDKITVTNKNAAEGKRTSFFPVTDAYNTAHAILAINPKDAQGEALMAALEKKLLALQGNAALTKPFGTAASLNPEGYRTIAELRGHIKQENLIRTNSNLFKDMNRLHAVVFDITNNKLSAHHKTTKLDELTAGLQASKQSLLEAVLENHKKGIIQPSDKLNDAIQTLGEDIKKTREDVKELVKQNPGNKEAWAEDAKKINDHLNELEKFLQRLPKAPKKMGMNFAPEPDLMDKLHNLKDAFANIQVSPKEEAMNLAPGKGDLKSELASIKDSFVNAIANPDKVAYLTGKDKGGKENER